MQNGFANALALYGPNGTSRPMSLPQARQYCGHLARSHYENFSVASLLLPRNLLAPFHAVYAYCRWADDLGDETGGGQHALDLLAWWRGQLLDCYAGKPQHPVMVALAPVIQQFQIPPEPFLNLLLAFEQDQRIQRYDTYEQLLGYCRNSADPVGHLVLYLCRSYSVENARLADRVCTGLQLANFWQDVDRDLNIRRIYLPREDCERFGYSEEDLQNRRYTPAFAALMSFEVDRARELLREGLGLVPRMPKAVRADIELFVRGGLAILEKVATQHYNVWQKRPALSKWEKLTLVGSVWLRKWKAAIQ